MGDRIVLIVGDKFLQFAASKDVMTVTQLRSLLSLPQMIRLDANRFTLLPGQGLGDDDMDAVTALAAASPHRESFNLRMWKQRPRRAPGKLSHKRRPENTLISEPRRRSEDQFEMDLLIDEDCELMADHQTGQHVQGMVLMEAARQSFLAVTEVFFLPADAGKFYFVINELSASYSRFAFPVDARIHYTIREKDIRNPLRQSFTADIEVEQCGQKAASFKAVFTVFEDQRISAKEEVLARDALNQHLAGYADYGRRHDDTALPLAA